MSLTRALSAAGFAGLFTALALAGSPSAQQAQEPVFRAGTRTVPVYVTVTDAEGRLVPDLGQDDFDILDNGKLQTISIFANDIQPIMVVMMLDRSGSMVDNFRRVQEAAEQFVTRLLPADKARIGSFSYRVQVDPRTFTNDRDELLRILYKELQEPGPTPLWNAVSVGMTALLRQEGRRVVLVFTDGADRPGDDRATNISLGDLMKRAREEDVMVYGVGLAGRVSMGGMGRRGGYGGGRYPPPPGGGLGRAHAEARRGPLEAGGRVGRRLLRARIDRRSRRHLRPRGRRTAPPVRDGLLAREARRQDAQARGAREEAGDDSPRAQELRGHAAADRMTMTPNPAAGGPSRLRTARLELVPGTPALGRAEMGDRAQFAKLLGADVPISWPPPENDEKTMTFFTEYVEKNPDAVGWAAWYILLRRRTARRPRSGHADSRRSRTGRGRSRPAIPSCRNTSAVGMRPRPLPRSWSGRSAIPAVERIIAHTFPDLRASIRVLEKCGFAFVGAGEEEGTIRFERRR